MVCYDVDGVYMAFRFKDVGDDDDGMELEDVAADAKGSGRRRVSTGSKYDEDDDDDDKASKK